MQSQSQACFLSTVLHELVFFLNLCKTSANIQHVVFLDFEVFEAHRIRAADAVDAALVFDCMMDLKGLSNEQESGTSTFV